MQPKRYRIEEFLPRSRAQSASAAPNGAVGASAGNGPLEGGAAELAAAMEAMEKACACVLGTAERVEDHARTLANAAETDHIRALAGEIREQMARVYEVCNFQDVAGQRITKVIRLLTGYSETAPTEGAAHNGAALLNGPRLDGASGHVSQADVDALFGYGRAST